jgi:hypothetical protein
MDQQWHETVGRQQEWMADQLGTPWAVQIEQGKVSVINKDAVSVISFALESMVAVMVAAEITKSINDRY